MSDYSEYIAENLDSSIEYSEYIAENLDKSIDYKRNKLRKLRKTKLEKIFNEK